MKCHIYIRSKAVLRSVLLHFFICLEGRFWVMCLLLIFFSFFFSCQHSPENESYHSRFSLQSKGTSMLHMLPQMAVLHLATMTIHHLVLDTTTRCQLRIQCTALHLVNQCQSPQLLLYLWHNHTTRCVLILR